MEYFWGRLIRFANWLLSLAGAKEQVAPEEDRFGDL